MDLRQSCFPDTWQGEYSEGWAALRNLTYRAAFGIRTHVLGCLSACPSSSLGTPSLLHRSLHRSVDGERSASLCWWSQLPVERTEETFSELKAPRHQRLNRQKKPLRENLFGLCSQEPKLKKKNYLELTQSSENKAIISTESLQSYRAYMNCNFQRFLTQPSLDRCLQEHWKLLASVPSPCQIAVQNKVTVKYIQWFWYKLHMQNKRKHLIYN